MKANQKFLHEEEAVSPVIAVILMVAITVVLAATVFVLVNDLGKNVGQTGPSLGLVSDSAQSSTTQWTIKVSSATKLSDLADYRFVLTTPSHGIIVATPTSSTFTSTLTQYAQQAALDTSRKTADATADSGTVTDNGYRLRWTDIDGNNKWSVGDVLSVGYDGSETANTYDSAFAAGEYSLEILHTPSGSSSASLPRTF